jgi:hypothetical protein
MKLSDDKKLIVELTLMLVLKLLLLTIIWYQFFSTSPALDNQTATSNRILQPSSGEQP